MAARSRVIGEDHIMSETVARALLIGAWLALVLIIVSGILPELP